MRQRLILLTPSGPMLAAGGRASDLFFRSDTLSAALVSCLAQLGLDVDGPDGIARNPPFRVSSALPVLWESNKSGGLPHVFFPVPDVYRMQGFRRESPGARWAPKSVKRIQYADEQWLQPMTKAEDPTAGWVVLEEGGHLLAVDWSNPGKQRVLAVTNPRTGLCVDRRTGGPIEDLLFEVVDIQPADPDFRLGVVLECDDAWLGRLQTTFRTLGLAGIGPKRTSGRAQFEVTTDMEFQGPALGDGGHLLLSLYHPALQEVRDGVLRRARFRLVQRSGFVTAPGAMTLRRQRVTMLTEGSVFEGPCPEGDVVQVLDPNPALGLGHPVYRDGRAVCIPIEKNSIGG